MQRRFSSVRTYGWYLLISVILFAIFFYLYEPITLGLDLEDLLTLGVPILLGVTALQWLVRSSLWHKAFLSHGIVGLAWALTFPILFHWSYEKPFYFYEFAPDFLWGLALFGGLFLLHYIVTHWSHHPIVSMVMTIIQFALLLIPLGQIGYYLSSWHCITPASLMALYQTNPEEAFGFIKNAGPMAYALGAVIIVLLGLLYVSNRTMKEFVQIHPWEPTARKSVVTVCTIALLGPASFYLAPKTNIIANWFDVDAYMKELQTYHDVHSSIYEKLELSTKETAAQKTPGTIILVIGESSSRDYMKVYNADFQYEDTPWQSSLTEDPNFTIFRHGYSSYVQTVPTLERALTERNQYEDKPFLDAVTILDVAKKAGYHTTWLSNQGVYGEYDTAISLMAKTAHTQRWAHESYAFSDQYDGALFPLLKEVPTNQNNFIVIHIMGSHIYYNDRYPSEFSKWKKGEYPKGLEAYANSQLYTDWLLQEIYTYGKEHLNLQAMVYFSDHGENIQTSHNPDIFDFDMTRIPFWVYTSPTYAAAYPQTVSTLRSREREYFTNDLLYDLLVGIMQAPSPYYDASRDFSHPSYRFNQNNLTTMLGTQPLSKDTEPK